MNKLIQERNQLAESAGMFADIKAQVARLVEENAQLKTKVAFYDMDRDDAAKYIKALLYDKMALHVVIGQIGQAVVDGRLKGVGAWYRELRRIAG